MNRTFVIILLILAVTAGGYCVSQFHKMGAAQAQTIPNPPADGSQADAPAVPAKAQQVKDPTEDAAGFYEDVKGAKKKGGWLGAILVGVWGLCKLLARVGKNIKMLAWMDKGRTAMVIAAVATVASAGVDAIFLGGSLSTVLVSMLWAGVGFMAPGTKPQANPA